MNAVIELPDVSDLRFLALHEGGHASCAVTLGLAVTAIEIDHFDGFSFIPDHERARPNVRLAVLMAGAAADREFQFLGWEVKLRPLDNSDQQRIADVLTQIDRRTWPFALAQARQQAQRMVRQHRSRIFMVADALLERCAVAGEPRGRLDGDALVELLGDVAILRLTASG